jgi:hypothetical protein
MTDNTQNETVTVSLTGRSVQALQSSVIRTEDRGTDIINRALQVYDFATEQEARGFQIMVYDPRRKEMSLVKFS